MTIGEAARLSGVAAKTIRYYESVGLLAAGARRGNGYRDYDMADVDTLRFIHRARGLGFAVKDVGNLLALWRDRSRASAEVRALAERHIAAIDAKMTELAAMRAVLAGLTAQCCGDQRPECPILDSLAGETADRTPAP